LTRVVDVVWDASTACSNWCSLTWVIIINCLRCTINWLIFTCYICIMIDTRCIRAMMDTWLDSWFYYSLFILTVYLYTVLSLLIFIIVCSHVIHVHLPSFYTLIGSFLTLIDLHIQVWVILFADQIFEEDHVLLRSQESLCLIVGIFIFFYSCCFPLIPLSTRLGLYSTFYPYIIMCGHMYVLLQWFFIHHSDLCSLLRLL